jgi:pilus assembly protein Flp/PilA
LISVTTPVTAFNVRLITMMKLLKSIKVSKSGASAAEYALILAIVGGGIVAGAIALKGAIGGALNGTSNVVNTATTNQTNAATPAS